MNPRLRCNWGPKPDREHMPDRRPVRGQSTDFAQVHQPHSSALSGSSYRRKVRWVQAPSQKTRRGAAGLHPNIPDAAREEKKTLLASSLLPLPELARLSREKASQHPAYLSQVNFFDLPSVLVPALARSPLNPFVVVRPVARPFSYRDLPSAFPTYRRDGLLNTADRRAQG
jgi:hypothetical protein